MSGRDDPYEESCEVLIIGGGASGLSLAYHLTAARARGVTVIEAPDGPLRPPERTWCFWDEGTGDFDAVVCASFSRLRVHGTGGEALTVDPSPVRYRMIRSAPFERMVHHRLARSPGGRLLRATAGAVRSTPGGALVRCTAADGRRLTLRARHVFDSRPVRTLPPARTHLTQHFRGWFVRTAADRFDPSVADLMDFRVPQPRHGLAFGYVLPLAPNRALVEYTEFSRTPLPTEAYEAALARYCRHTLDLPSYTVESAEQGVIPMTDARFPRRSGPAVFRIGTAGGATRPATGYTFAAAQRQARTVAAALRRGRVEVPAPHGRRARAMDAVLLRALDTGRIDGPDFFTGLFRRVPPTRLLRFLDGATSPWEEAGIGLRTPVGPMLRTALELPFLPRRPHPVPRSGEHRT
ncbi:MULTISPECIES: lycopene cyclase family protein [Streptomyces]|uniref:Putative lycopene cyclase n=1 Tax=Streptomyces albus (strain ATCC 21838 / DSM 41398 / FERM P-419 / JCM 4703 / NBRC 107858) TaxID=1081613 RepID=A0A0B5ETP4_STRA4|nr:lycopene cyclase family protein [Streptomyces sp. SCSIO ZS0520]AJE81482.1 putative lycopene cyclase [Streptomyces albus]AOU75797.1 putative lycopene cyclase [Streptomyces albus]AYN31600.1 lycopene cyclase [Streptomyces albus]